MTEPNAQRARERLLVRDLMAVGVATCPPTTPIVDVARLLLEKQLEVIVVLDEEGEAHQDAALGNGPVDAICNCINRITGTEAHLTEFHVHAVTAGIDAIADVTMRIEMTDDNGKKYLYSGRSADTDTMCASGKAYLSALNKGLRRKQNAPASSKQP